jgi:nucleoside-diphosphate-sugar epimerase
VLVKGHVGEPYNVGIERPEISMAELAQKVIDLSRELFGYPGKLVRKPNPEETYLIDNPNRRCPNIEKGRVHLGYNPTVLVDEGLRRTMMWYHHNREAEEA